MLSKVGLLFRLELAFVAMTIAVGTFVLARAKIVGSLIILPSQSGPLEAAGTTSLCLRVLFYYQAIGGSAGLPRTLVRLSRVSLYERHSAYRL